jgi:hypothetical protein
MHGAAPGWIRDSERSVPDRSAMPNAPRSLGIRIITGYKLAKAPFVLMLAVWLSLAPHSAVHLAERIVREIAEGGSTLGRFSRWLNPHVTTRFAVRAAAVAWVDGLSTAVEGLLLFQGSVWGEWIVVATLGALVPFETVSLERHPSAMRLTILLINALIVAYLILERLRAKRTRADAANAQV